MPVRRKIVEIDEEKCDGCGDCITACHEGALQLVNGKARLVKDDFCDGLGACLGDCPRGAITITERDAEVFDEAAVARHLAAAAHPAPRLAIHVPHHAGGGGCPGSAMRNLSPTSRAPAASPTDDQPPPSQLAHWPVQLMLVPPHAQFLRGADLVVCADCAPLTVPDFHQRYLNGRAIVIGCPKLDDLNHYSEKLAAMVEQAQPTRVTVVRMEVPCCRGLADVALRAAQAPGMTFQLEEHIVGIGGAITRRVVRAAALAANDTR